jgi:hypothetical protein
VDPRGPVLYEFGGTSQAYEIKVLDLMDVDVQRAFLALARELGSVVRAKTWSYLILGGDDPVLVDTGASDLEIMGRLGMTGYVEEWQGLDAQLELHDLGRDDTARSSAAPFHDASASD